MIKLDIITGFLGAGKTTLINKLLAEAYIDEKPVLIENEFGEVSIDDSLVDPEIQVRTLTSGCICCTLSGDFINGIIQVIEQYQPTRIIIEPTGLAEPKDILAACAEAQEQVDVAVNLFITVVDGANFLPLYYVTGDLFKRQINDASLIVLNRSKQLTTDELAETLQLLTELNDAAPILDEDSDSLDGLSILAIGETIKPAAYMSQPAATLSNQAVYGDKTGVDEHNDHDDHPASGNHDEHNDHSDSSEHSEHDHQHADIDGTTSLAFQPNQVFSTEIIEALFAELASGRYGKIYRAKGFVKHAAGGFRHLEYVYSRGQQFSSSYAGQPKLVVIGEGLDEPGLQSLID
ncbi:MAG: GTP-binding protein, partial [Coriobacteriales bacterium]|nr:GTP-binding protein [Coriobacteriales bacterium]